MGEVDAGVPARSAAQLLSAAEDNAAQPRERVAAARELADLDGHQAEAVALLTGLANARGGGVERRRWWLTGGLKRKLWPDAVQIDWLRLGAAEALVDLPGQRAVGVATLVQVAGDPDFSVPARKVAACRLAEIDGQAEIGAALLARLSTDRRVGIVHRVFSARELSKIPGHEAAGIGILTDFVADAALSDEERLVAAQYARDLCVPGQADAGAALLTRLVDDAAFDATKRVEAAELLAAVEGQRDNAATLLITFAGQDGYWSAARVRAAQALTGLAGYEPRGVELLTRLADDPALGHGERYGGPSRADAAATLARIPGQLEAGADRLVRIAQGADGPVSVLQRMTAAEALSRHESYRSAAADLLTRMAKDRNLDATNRANAAGSLSYIDGRKREALVLLDDIGRLSTEPFDHARTLAAYLRKELDASPD